VSENTKNEKPTGIFNPFIIEGVFMKAVFDNNSVLKKAVIRDIRKGLKIKIKRYGSKVTFELKWKDFEVKLTKDFGYNIPPFLSENEFTTLYKTPLEYYKGVISVLEDLLGNEYVYAQKVYEEEGE